MSLLICGSIATDHLMSFPGKFSDSLVVDQLDKLSVSFLVEELEVRRGGCAANICFGLGNLGLRPVLIGAVAANLVRTGDPVRGLVYVLLGWGSALVVGLLARRAPGPASRSTSCCPAPVRRAATAPTAASSACWVRPSISWTPQTGSRARSGWSGW